MLTPANDPDAPGYDSEKHFARHHPVRPPDLDKARLAALEAQHEQGALTAEQEAELIALLAKVKGVHIQRLDQLSKKPKHSPTPTKWKEKGGRVEVLENGDWKYTDWKGKSVVYHNGFPIFDPHASQQVDIGDMKGNYTSDFDEADEKAPLGPKKAGSTWHHHENLRTMQELPRDIHDRFTHYGAASILKKQQVATAPAPAVTPPKSIIRKKKKL